MIVRQLTVSDLTGKKVLYTTRGSFVNTYNLFHYEIDDVIFISKYVISVPKVKHHKTMYRLSVISRSIPVKTGVHDKVAAVKGVCTQLKINQPDWARESEWLADASHSSSNTETFINIKLAGRSAGRPTCPPSSAKSGEWKDETFNLSSCVKELSEHTD